MSTSSDWFHINYVGGAPDPNPTTPPPPPAPPTPTGEMSMADYQREFDLVTKRQLMDLAKGMENGLVRVQARHVEVVARLRQLVVALVPYAFDQRKRQELVDDWTLE